MKTGDGMKTKVLHCTLITIATCLTMGAFASICFAQDAQLSNRALREIGFDSTEVLDTKVLWQDGGGNSITKVNKGKTEYLVTVRTRIHHENLYQTFNGMLVITETIEEIVGPWEGNKSELHARAVLFDTKGNGKQLWELTEEADAGTLSEDGWSQFYTTTENGCCDARPLHTSHSLNTGEMVMQYHSNLICAKQISFCFSKAVISDPDYRYDSLFVGILYMTNDDSVLHALKVRASSFDILEPMGSETYYWPWTVELTDSAGANRLCRTLECSPTGVVISSVTGNRFESENIAAQVSFDGPIIIIPIRDDDFVLEQTEVNGFELIRLK